MGTEPQPADRSPDAFGTAYDAYLDACLEGTAEPPEAFCAGHAIEDPALIARIESLYAAVGAGQATHAGHAPPSPATTSEGKPRALPYERVAGYRLVRRLGVGGMGEVYLAEQEALGRLVALKVIRPELQAHEGVAKRFEREAQAVARLRHDGIVTVHELGQDGDLHFIAMELVAGRPLDQIVAESPLDPDDALRWGAEVADALAYAHGEGVVHRDVKPSNIVITPEGRAILLDFGMVHLADTDATRLTQTFAGSPGYAAPEQVQSGDVDARTDVYALGVTLFECLTGSMPFPGTNLGEVFRAILTELPPPVGRLREGLPPKLDLVVAKCLEKRPGDRYPTAGALKDDLDALRRKQAVAARRPSTWRRLRGWCRRRPVHAATLLTLVVAAVGFGLWKLDDIHRERQRARDLVASAEADVAEYDRIGPEIVKTERALRSFLGSGKFEPPNPASQREHEALRDRSREYTGRLQALANAADSKLREARRVDADVDGADRVEALLLVRQLESAIRLENDDLAEQLRSRLLLVDPAGTYTNVREGQGTYQVRSNPPGAEVYIWRYESQRDIYPGEGDRRLVPVSLGEPPEDVRYGAFALRVIEPLGAFEREDLITEIDGHALRDAVFVASDAPPFRAGDRLVRIGDQVIAHPTEYAWLIDKQGANVTLIRDGETLRLVAGETSPQLVTPWQRAARGGAPVKVFRRGRLVDAETPSGLLLRPTATPVYLRTDRDRLGKTGGTRHTLDPGQYLLLVRKAGMEDAWAGVQVVPFEGRTADVQLVPVGTTPPGFVFYPLYSDEHPPFWIMEREVTMGEYLEYLNTPIAQHYIGLNTSQGKYVLFPRNNENYTTGGYWPRGADGKYRLPPNMPAGLPIAAVSFEDARMYAGWRSVRDQRKYALPTHYQWKRASGTNTGRRFACGEEVRQTWVSSNYARAYAGLKRVLQFPIDESPERVYDLMGSMREMLEHEWGTGEYPNSIRVVGYDWGSPAGDQNRISSGVGQEKGGVNNVTGFRLVIPWKEPSK